MGAATTFCRQYYDLSKYNRKLTAGTFFSKFADKSELGSIYRVIKNIKPCLGNVASNLMFLNKMPGILGEDDLSEDKMLKMSERMFETVLNFPTTKEGLVAITRKMMSDGNKLHVAMRMITKEAINLISRIYHLLAIAMALLGEQMRILESKKTLGRHLMAQFAKQTKFGPIITQLEFLAQQYHCLMFRAIPGITVKGAPRLILDCSDCSYVFSGAHEKWSKKTDESEKYVATRARMRDLDLEEQGNRIYIYKKKCKTHFNIQST